MPGNPRPWRIMVVLFGGVLLCSIGLQKLVSPVGDAMVRAVDGKPVALTGTIHAQFPAGDLVFQDGAVTYVLADPAKARPYAGRRVRVTGILRESTGRLEIRSIASLLDRGANSQ